MAIDASQLFCIPTWLIAGILLFTVYYIFQTWHIGYWKSQGVPIDKPWPILGNLGKRCLLNKTLHEDDMSVYMRLGPIWGTVEGRTPALFIADPDLAKLILVKDFNHFTDRKALAVGHTLPQRMLTAMKGEEWKRTRNILTPAFTSGKLKRMSDLIENSAQNLVKNLEDSEDVKRTVDTKLKTAECLMDVIANCAFGIQINTYDKNNKFVHYVANCFEGNLGLSHLVCILYPWMSTFMHSASDDLAVVTHSYKCLEKIVSDVIEKRREGKTSRIDFVQLLFEAQIQEMQKSELDNGHVTENLILTDETVIAQCLVFLFAGYETTSSTLSHLFYELALNGEIQQKLIDEIDKAVETHGNLKYDVVMNLPYLDMVVSETLRKYPIITRIERICTKDYTLGNIIIKKGMLVSVPIYVMHHDEKYYPNADKFDPERFTTENRKSLASGAYLPFASGPRNCIGSRFALLAMKTLTAHLLKNFRIEKSDKTPVSLDFASVGAFLRIKKNKEIIVQLSKRHTDKAYV